MVRIGVIGIGRMGGRHARNIAKGRVKDCVLTAVCDIDEAKLTKFVESNNKIRTFTDYKEMLKSGLIEAVIIATPHYFHVPIAIDCLEGGMNILVEKPIAVTVGEAVRLNEIAKQHQDKKFAIMFNQRTNRMYKKAKEIIASGKLGEIRRANFIVTDWYRSEAYFRQGGWRASWSGEGGGALINQCVHQLDILQWLIGMPESIYSECHTRNRNITVENEVVALFKYKNNMTATFTAATNELIGTNRLEIAGDRGRILIDKFKMKFIAFTKSEIEVNDSTKRGYGFTTFKVSKTKYGFINMIRDVVFGQQINIIRNFTKAIQGKEELVASGIEGINALSLINGIYMADSLRTTVNLPLDSKAYDDLLAKKIEKETIKRGK